MKPHARPLLGLALGLLLEAPTGCTRHHGENVTGDLFYKVEKGSPAACAIKVTDGALVVDIPDQAMLALDDPDDRGRWVCKAARLVYVTFDRETNSGRAEVVGRGGVGKAIFGVAPPAAG